jgi:hypothetical protein
MHVVDRRRPALLNAALTVLTVPYGTEFIASCQSLPVFSGKQETNFARMQDDFD